MASLPVDDVRAVVHRLFIASNGPKLRKEDEQKSKELAPLLGRLAKLRTGAHLVDAAAGKASLGLVAAELLPIRKLTVIERDASRIVACRDAHSRLTTSVPMNLVHAELADDGAWPSAPDVVVGLHACGPASDVLIDQAIRVGARHVLVVPCCYGSTIPFFPGATALVAGMPFVADNLVRRRMVASLIDMERKLRLEAAGYETTLEEFVGATVTAHNMLVTARRTNDRTRVERAVRRRDELHTRASTMPGARSSMSS